jgi:hypothetical protein
MTQLGIESTGLLIAWRRLARDPGDRDSELEFAAGRARLFIVLMIAIGFILGATCGAISYAETGLSGAPIAAALVGALTLWSIRRQRRSLSGPA